MFMKYSSHWQPENTSHILSISFPTDDIVVNADPEPLDQDFINLVGGAFSNAHTGQFRAIKSPFHYRPVQILQFVDGAAGPAIHLVNFD